MSLFLDLLIIHNFFMDHLGEAHLLFIKPVQSKGRLDIRSRSRLSQ